MNLRIELARRTAALQPVLRADARRDRRRRARRSPVLAVDRHVDTTLADLPLGFTSTVESARTLLGVIAGATISFAGIAFSVSLLIIQLASSQYSPRVVHTLFRDPFNKRVMALVVGTFTYCVVVLRSVRSALDPGGDPVDPQHLRRDRGRARHRHDPRHRRVHQPQRARHGRQRDPRTDPPRDHRPDPCRMDPRRAGRDHRRRNPAADLPNRRR